MVVVAKSSVVVARSLLFGTRKVGTFANLEVK